MDAFAELGLERRLVISDEEIRAAFREAGKSRHPDAGGDAGDFERLQQAVTLLTDPSERLKQWLELEGIEGSLRGAVGSGVMDLFSEIGRKLQQADAVIREKEAAQSLLAKALLEAKAQDCRERLEVCQQRLEVERRQREESFPAVESGRADGWQLARELAFIGKWLGQVRARYAALW
ncbi:hypothetical protein [Haloferula sargassicola]|uniref:J domain-containing protein n=1 Tax=Haloferula sargassicola TaxID=490096 RepID=A0ABP9ULN0_9BACT